MKIVFRLIRWVWRSWPLFVVSALGCIHLFLIRYTSLDVRVINETVSLLAQLSGGILILYSIDSNIGIIEGKHLFGLLANYFKEFPLLNKPVVLGLQGTISATSALGANLSISRNPKSIDEKIEYIQEQIDEMRRYMLEELRAIARMVASGEEKTSKHIVETEWKLRDIETKLQKVSVGGIKVQLLGVLLMIYGAISGYLA